MKGKKRKKGTNSNYKSQSSVQAKAAESARIDEEVRERKRLKSVARNILLVDLVMLALCQLLISMDKINTMTANIITLLGIVLLIVALWVQFGQRGKIDDNTRKGGWSF